MLLKILPILSNENPFTVATNLTSDVPFAIVFFQIFSAIFSVLLSIAITVLFIVSLCEVFRKLGEYKCGKAAIPFYNGYILFKILGDIKYFGIAIGFFALSTIFTLVGMANPMMFFVSGILIIPSIVFQIICLYKLNNAFGKNIGGFLGLIFFNVIFLAIIAFGKSRCLINRYGQY